MVPIGMPFRIVCVTQSNRSCRRRSFFEAGSSSPSGFPATQGSCGSALKISKTEGPIVKSLWANPLLNPNAREAPHLGQASVAARRLAQRMDYSIRFGTGKAALQWTDPMGGGAPIQVPLVALLYDRTLVASMNRKRPCYGPSRWFFPQNPVDFLGS